MKRIDQVLILGGGSAGWLTALALRAKIPTLKVTVMRSPEIGVIGVGEGTIWTMPIFLHGYLGIDPKCFHDEVHPTYKLGIRFLWGPRPEFYYTFDRQLNWRFDKLPKPNGFYCDETFDFANITSALMAHNKVFERQDNGAPYVSQNAAYHLENQLFVKFLESHALSQGIQLIEDTLVEVEQDAVLGVTELKLASGRRVAADLYVDCSGFRSELLSGAMQEPFDSYDSSLFCDRALVGGWARTDEPLLPFTTAETMNGGWAWQIEHEQLINRGYVYSSDFISDEDAERELREKNPKLDALRVVRFRSGKYRNLWVKNVVAMGNASGFVEPMSATALWIICNAAVQLVYAISDGDGEVGSQQVRMFNQTLDRMWESVRRFLSLHYKFNTRLDTPFWQACRADTDLAGAEQFVDYYQSVGPSIHGESLLGPGDLFELEGYLVMLVGQRVPYRRTHTPHERDIGDWTAIKGEYARRARAAMPQEEALRIIRSEDWNWAPDFYPAAVPWR